MITDPRSAVESGADRASTQRPGYSSASTQKRILDAAVTCLAEAGYTATTMQRVIELAGVSRGAALHHYPNKLEMLSAVVRQAASTCIGLVDAHLGICPPGIERVTLLVDALWRFLNTTSAHALFEIEVAARGDPEVAERVFPVMQMVHELLERLFVESCSKAQPFDEEASRSAAKLLMGSMRGVALEARSGGVDATGAARLLWVDSLKEVLLRQFRGGV